MTKKREKARHEVEAIERFIDHLQATRGVAYRITAEDVVVDPAKGTNYDYQLAAEGNAYATVAVEIFRLVEDEADLAAQQRRGLLWAAIKIAFEAAGLRDLVVSTPFSVSVLPRDQPAYAKGLTAAAVKALAEHPAAQEVQLDGGISLRRTPGLGTVACSSHSDARWIDGVGIATPPLIKSLAKKDSQLAVDGLERIILCVNWAWAVDPDDAINAIAMMDVTGLAHVDRVYFDSGKGHTLIYARSVREALAGAEQPPWSDPVAASLFEKSLCHRLEKDVPGSLELVRRVSAGPGLAWIKDRHRREGVIRAAQRRVRPGDAEAGLWAVGVAKGDPDPPLVNYADDPDGSFNYHEQVRRGGDPSTSVGVRSAVCWLIQTLICKCPTDAWHLIEVVEELATGTNLYVRQNACVPLIEFAVRRRWRDGSGIVMPEDVRRRAKRLAFLMLRENQDYPAVLKWLAHVFSEMLDLTDGEAQEALEGLVGRTPDDGIQSVARILLFFAALRAGHPAFPGAFDSTHARRMLEDALERGSPEFRRALSYTMLKTVEEEPQRASELRPYILRLPRAGLDGLVPQHFYEMAEVLFIGADNELENAIATMVEAEAAWAMGERGRFVMVSTIIPLLKKLADATRWTTVIRVAKSLASCKHAILGGTSELGELLKLAPIEFGREVAALGFQYASGEEPLKD